MSAVRRIYDSDVVSNEEALRALAASVALTYSGNWDAMIGWQQHCRERLPLGVKDVRAILNAALSDATQSNWHGPINSLVDRSSIVLREPRPEKPRLTVVREPVRKVVNRVPARFHGDMLRPRHTSGKLHVVDHDRTYVDWRVQRDWDRNVDFFDRARVGKVVVAGICRKQYDNPIPRDLEPGEAWPVDELCVGCARELAAR